MSPQHEDFQHNTIQSKLTSRESFLVSTKVSILNFTLCFLTAKKNPSVFLNILSSLLNRVHFHSDGRESIHTVSERNYVIVTNRPLKTAFGAFNNYIRLYTNFTTVFKNSLQVFLLYIPHCEVSVKSIDTVTNLYYMKAAIVKDERHSLRSIV